MGYIISYQEVVDGKLLLKNTAIESVRVDNWLAEALRLGRHVILVGAVETPFTGHTFDTISLYSAPIEISDY